MKIRKLNDSNGKEHCPYGWLDIGITRSWGTIKFGLTDWIIGRKTIRRHIDRGTLWETRPGEYLISRHRKHMSI